MDSSTLLVVAAIAAVALGCQAADPESGPDRGGTAATVMRGVSVLLAVYFVLLGVSNLLSAASGGETLGGGDHSRSTLAAGGALQLGGSLIALAAMLAGTRRIPGLRALRPRAPITWFGLILFTQALAANLTPETASATVASTVSKPESSGDLIVGVLPFGIIGLAAVGPVVRRNGRETLRRLGLVPLQPGWWLLGIALGIVLVPAGDALLNGLNRLTSPDCLVQQQQVAQSLQGASRTAVEQIGIAVAAGVCEELLFRGVLQPRFGILLSSGLWASFHLQYTCHGLPSVSNLYILVLGIIFGIARRERGLGTAILAHMTYDATILLGAF